MDIDYDSKGNCKKVAESAFNAANKNGGFRAPARPRKNTYFHQALCIWLKLHSSSTRVQIRPPKHTDATEKTQCRSELSSFPKTNDNRSQNNRYKIQGAALHQHYNILIEAKEPVFLLPNIMTSIGILLFLLELEPRTIP